jgi:SAM-dependent methyltransferase
LNGDEGVLMNEKKFLFLLLVCLSSSEINYLGASVKQVFSEIYENKIWGVNDAGEGWSGGGSSCETTNEYRDFIQKFLKEYGITSVLDLGCGDWEFSKFINWNGIDYLGLDAVPRVIKKNKERYEYDTIHFECADALLCDLPSAELLLCKDVLQHLTNEDILVISAQFKKYKYCLITNGVDYDTLSSDNADIQRGDYRPLDLTKPPFNISCIKIFSYRSGGFMMQTVLIENN